MADSFGGDWGGFSPSGQSTGALNAAFNQGGGGYGGGGLSYAIQQLIGQQQRQLLPLQTEAQKQLQAQQGGIQSMLQGQNISSEQLMQGRQLQGALQQIGAQFGGEAGLIPLQTQAAEQLAAQQGQVAQQLEAQKIAGEKELQGPQLQSAQQIAQIQAGASEFPAVQQMQRFGAVFPQIQGALKNAQNNLGAPGQVNQPIPPSAQTTSGNPADYLYGGPGGVQRQVNTAQAGTQQQAASNIRNIQNQLAGRGFGANSPLALSEAGRQQAMANAAGSAAEQGIRSTAAQTAGQLGQQQYGTAAQLAAALASQQTQGYLGRLGNLNTIISALAGAA